MKKKIICAFVLAAMIAGAIFAASSDTVVCITSAGAKYHTGSCSYLKKSKTEITLGAAVRQGYDPCSRCKPPRLSEE